LQAGSSPAGLSLPDMNYCGVLASNVQPLFNSPNLSPAGDCLKNTNCLDWPNQSWPGSGDTVSPPLNCPTTTANPPSPQIYFVATQFPVPVDVNLTTYPTSPQGCNTPIQPNNCNQIVMQTAQLTEVAGGTWQPALPLTIIGNGFGNLSNMTLPPVQNSSYLEIADCPNGGTNPPNCSGYWSTATASNCQMVISNWTDAGISVVANLPVGVQDGYEAQNFLMTVLSPLTDVSPWTFPAAAPATAGCPINYKDNLYFTVTNPQGGGATVTAVLVGVSQTGTSPL